MSTPFPVQVGTNYKDSIYLIDKATQLPITGKVNGDWTIQVARGTTGNISNAGITITEADAVNNAGVYDVVASGATSFTQSTAGKYIVTVFLTANTDYRFEQTVLVTANGDFDGTSGAARFTATSGDGRITDGTNPLTGATVRLLNSANTVLASLSVTSGGLWGPVFLDATITVVAQQSGYSVNNSNSVTVAGSVATGPLQDIALTAVTSASTILNSDLTAYARVQTRDSTGTKSDTVLQQAVNNAIAWIATAKFWEYYKTYGDLTLREPYSTGTLTLTNASTTVTLASGTWPTWAASGKLKIGGKVYRVVTRSSNAVVLLSAAWAEDSEAGTSYTLFQDEYALATDCLKFGRPLPGQGWGWGGAPASFESVLEAQNNFIYGQQYPSMFAVHASGNSAKLILYPYPSSSEDILLPYWYYRKPAILVAGNDTVDMDPLHLELAQRSIDYQVAMRFESCVAGTPEVCFKRLMECFQRYSTNDKGPMNPVGPMGSWRSQYPPDYRTPHLSG